MHKCDVYDSSTSTQLAGLLTVLHNLSTLGSRVWAKMIVAPLSMSVPSVIILRHMRLALLMEEGEEKELPQTDIYFLK